MTEQGYVAGGAVFGRLDGTGIGVIEYENREFFQDSSLVEVWLAFSVCISDFDRCGYGSDVVDPRGS